MVPRMLIFFALTGFGNSLTCLNCDGVYKPRLCRNITSCSTDEACLHEQVVDQYGQRSYNLKCVKTNACRSSARTEITPGSAIIGRSLGSSERISANSKSVVCKSCCVTDLCNAKCSNTKHDFPTDCLDILNSGNGSGSGVYRVAFWKSEIVKEVMCDLTTDGGGWTVIQSRFNGSVNFNRNYRNYSDGFGSVWGEFWLGLHFIRELVLQGDTELRIEVTTVDGSRGQEVYQHLFISKGPRLALHISRGNGTAGDDDLFGLYDHNNMSFSTFDKDNDASAGNCAAAYKAGWWWNDCMGVNLNGEYCTPGSTTCEAAAMTYPLFTGNEYVALKESRMMIRRVT